MKKVTTLTMLVAGLTAGAQAQGLINFSNLSSPGFSTGISAGGNSLNPGTYTVALYWDSTASAGSAGIDPSTGAFSSLTPEKTYSTSASDIPFPGGFQAGTVAIQGLATGAAGIFEVVAWTGNAADYASAAAGGASVGFSPLFSNPTGGSGSPASPPADLTGWNGNMALVPQTPEPTTIALGGLGAAALMMFRRRK